MCGSRAKPVQSIASALLRFGCERAAVARYLPRDGVRMVWSRESTKNAIVP